MRYLLTIIIFFVLFLSCPQASLAVSYGGSSLQQQTNAFAGTSGANFGEATDLRVVVARVIKTFLGFVGLLTVVYIMYGGFLYMTSGGSEERISKAGKIVGYGALGAAIILLSYSIAWFTYYLIYKGQQSPFGSYWNFWVEPDRTEYYIDDPLEQSTVPDQFNLFQ